MFIAHESVSSTGPLCGGKIKMAQCLSGLLQLLLRQNATQQR
jgi:hypothetical protein